MLPSVTTTPRWRSRGPTAWSAATRGCGCATMLTTTTRCTPSLSSASCSRLACPLGCRASAPKSSTASCASRGTCSSPRPRCRWPFSPPTGTREWRGRRGARHALERSVAHHTHGALRVGDAHRRRAGPVAHEHVAVRLLPGGGHARHCRGHRGADAPRGLHPRDHLRWLLGVPGRHVEGRYRLHHAGAAWAHRQHVQQRRAGLPAAALPRVRRYRRREHDGRCLRHRSPHGSRARRPVRGAVVGDRARPVHRRRGTSDGGEVGVPSRPHRSAGAGVVQQLRPGPVPAGGGRHDRLLRRRAGVRGAGQRPGDAVASRVAAGRSDAVRQLARAARARPTRGCAACAAVT